MKAPSWICKLRYPVALGGAAAAWLAQVNISYSLAARACYPHDVPLPAPLWNGLPFFMAIITLFTLCAGIFSSLVAVLLWRQARREPGDRNIDFFLSGFAIVSSGIFMAALIYAALGLLFVSPCRPWI